MDRADLNAHVRALATLPESDAPIVSCYLGITGGRLSRPEAFEERVRNLRSALSGRERQDLQDAIEPIRSFISSRLLPDAKGAAIFSRVGAQRFFLALQFRVPLPDWMAVDIMPNLYHLVRLEDDGMWSSFAASGCLQRCGLAEDMSSSAESWSSPA